MYYFIANIFSDMDKILLRDTVNIFYTKVNLLKRIFS